MDFSGGSISWLFQLAGCSMPKCRLHSHLMQGKGASWLWLLEHMRPLQGLQTSHRANMPKGHRLMLAPQLALQGVAHSWLRSWETGNSI